MIVKKIMEVKMLKIINLHWVWCKNFVLNFLYSYKVLQEMQKK
jgi:hypothetical protein